jgi:hypothetical protein
MTSAALLVDLATAVVDDHRLLPRQARTRA